MKPISTRSRTQVQTLRVPSWPPCLPALSSARWSSVTLLTRSGARRLSLSLGGFGSSAVSCSVPPWCVHPIFPRRTYISSHIANFFIYRTVACSVRVVSFPVSLSVLLRRLSLCINLKSLLLPFVVVSSRCNNGEFQQDPPLDRDSTPPPLLLPRSITWGILIQYFIQFGCSYINGVASFRIPWGLQMIPAIVLSLGMLVFPEVCRPLTELILAHCHRRVLVG